MSSFGPYPGGGLADKDIDRIADKTAAKLHLAVRQANEPVLEALGQIHAAVKDSNKPVLERLEKIDEQLYEGFVSLAGILQEIRDELKK